MRRGSDDRRRTAVGALAALVLCGTADGAIAGGRGRQRVAASAGLTVTGFAVPVGIPVAGAPLPLVVYSYRGVAGEASANAAGEVGRECTCGTCGCGGSGVGDGGPRPAGEEAGSVTTLTEPAAAEPRGAVVLREKCARCHGGEAAEGKVRLWERETGAWLDGWRRGSGTIYRAVRDGRMPKGGPPLSDEEFAAVVDYLLSTEPGGEAEAASAGEE